MLKQANASEVSLVLAMLNFYFFVSKLSLRKMGYMVKENELYGKLYGTMLKLWRAGHLGWLFEIDGMYQIVTPVSKH